MTVALYTCRDSYCDLPCTLSAQIELDSIRADPPSWADCGHARIRI